MMDVVVALMGMAAVQKMGARRTTSRVTPPKAVVRYAAVFDLYEDGLTDMECASEWQ